MPTIRVIAGMDCQHGRVVHRRAQQPLADVGDPVEMAHAYQAQGADELVIGDAALWVDVTRQGLKTLDAIRQVLSIPLTVGGAIRHVRDVHALLDVGADKVFVDETALEHPQIIADIATRHGSQCVVLAINVLPNARGGWDVVRRRDQQNCNRDALAWAQHAQDLGIGEILLNSREREGTRCGFDLKLVQTVAQAVHVPVVAAGGADTTEGMLRAVQAGAEALVVGSLLHDRAMRIEEIKAALHARGLWIRPVGQTPTTLAASDKSVAIDPILGHGLQ